MFENPRSGRQARNFTTNVSKILDLKSPSEQIFFRKFSLGAPVKCIIRYNIECCRKYIGQIYTDSLVHDEKALKLLVDTIGQEKSSVTF